MRRGLYGQLSYPEPQPDPPPMPSVSSKQDEEERADRWAWFVREVQTFMALEGGGRKGAAAALRAFGEAISCQPELFL